jgi:hypothetical protein
MAKLMDRLFNPEGIQDMTLHWGFLSIISSFLLEIGIAELQNDYNKILDVMQTVNNYANCQFTDKSVIAKYFSSIGQDIDKINFVDKDGIAHPITGGKFVNKHGKDFGIIEKDYFEEELESIRRQLSAINTKNEYGEIVGYNEGIKYDVDRRIRKAHQYLLIQLKIHGLLMMPGKDPSESMRLTRM